MLEKRHVRWTGRNGRLFFDAIFSDNTKESVVFTSDFMQLGAIPQPSPTDATTAKQDGSIPYFLGSVSRPNSNAPYRSPGRIIKR
jgi:hypothetical protein